jgi:hypothetical protein
MAIAEKSARLVRSESVARLRVAIGFQTRSPARGTGLQGHVSQARQVRGTPGNESLPRLSSTKLRSSKVPPWAEKESAGPLCPGLPAVTAFPRLRRAMPQQREKAKRGKTAAKKDINNKNH